MLPSLHLCMRGGPSNSPAFDVYTLQSEKAVLFERLTSLLALISSLPELLATRQHPDRYDRVIPGFLDYLNASGVFGTPVSPASSAPPEAPVASSSPASPAPPVLPAPPDSPVSPSPQLDGCLVSARSLLEEMESRRAEQSAADKSRARAEDERLEVAAVAADKLAKANRKLQGERDRERAAHRRLLDEQTERDNHSRFLASAGS